MNLMTHQLPENPNDWPHWLERQLVGLHLGELVVELEALLGEPSHAGETSDNTVTLEPVTLKTVCGDRLQTVLRQGLAALHEEQIRTLLKHSSLLLPLQELVLEHGGQYWQQLPRAAELIAQSQQYGAQLAEKLEAPQPQIKSEAPRSGRYLGTLVFIAAALVVGATIWLSRPVAPTWGFDRNGLLTANVSGPEYLNSLANAANEWFKKHPETTSELDQRLTQFIHGCDTLIAAEHSQLNADDKAWLQERCQAWQAKLAAQRENLRSGTAIAAVQTESDNIINQLVAAIKKRAEQA